MSSWFVQAVWEPELIYSIISLFHYEHSEGRAHFLLFPKQVSTLIKKFRNNIVNYRIAYSSTDLLSNTQIQKLNSYMMAIFSSPINPYYFYDNGRPTINWPLTI